MLVSSEGILLQQIRYSDQHNIIRVYTRKFGMLSLLARAGKRKGQSRVFFQLMLPVEIQFQLRENRTLLHMQQMQILHPVHQISHSPVKTAQMLFLAELILKSVREEERNDGLFDFILNSILLLDGSASDLPDFHLKFMLELSGFLGFLPADNSDENNKWFSIAEGAFMKQSTEFCLDEMQSKMMILLMRSPFEQLNILPMNGVNRRAILNSLLRFYQWHLPTVKDMKTPQVLEEVFKA